jgi:hypothetical protein
MVRNILLSFTLIIPIALSSLGAQDADPIEAARQAKLAAEKAAAAAEAATGAAIEAAASKAAAGAREKIIADREAEKARLLAEKEAAENAEIDAAAAAAGLEARRKLAAELGLELEEVPDSSVTEELDNLEQEPSDLKSSFVEGFNFGLASSVGFVSGEAISDTPLGGTLVITTPYGAKVGPLNLSLSIGMGGYTGSNDNGTELNPMFFGAGANAILSELVFSETHVGLVGKGFGFRQFAGITLERLMKKSFNLPLNVLIGGEGFLSTDIEGSGISTYWGGLGFRLDYSF